MSLPLKSALHDWHQAHGGRLVEFGGWSMPVQYTSIVEEHKSVRNQVGLFDISHMGRLLFTGLEALPWIDHVTTNHVAKLVPGQIQYSLIVNANGGVIDDILVYHTPDNVYSIVCNASNRASVVNQLRTHKLGRQEIDLVDSTLDTTMIAVQGPEALAVLQSVCNASLAELGYYRAVMADVAGAVSLVSRTGYTGEDGFEISLGNESAVTVWEALLDAGRSRSIIPCGLGARDTLRFEAAMPLYGHEMDESTNPYAVGLGWAVKLNKGDFIGRDALAKFKADPGRTRVGLHLAGKRIARLGAPVLVDGRAVGVVTSGTFAPTLGQSLAMASIDPAHALIGTELSIDVRGHIEPAQVVRLPFYARPAL